MIPADLNRTLTSGTYRGVAYWIDRDPTWHRPRAVVLTLEFAGWSDSTRFSPGAANLTHVAERAIDAWLCDLIRPYLTGTYRRRRSCTGR